MNGLILPGVFVTAKLKDKNDHREGAVISVNPLRIRGQTGAEYDCEGRPKIVINPPENCMRCGFPLGRLCFKCRTM